MHGRFRERRGGWLGVGLTCVVAAVAAAAHAQAPGDVNCDGVVNSEDLPALVAVIFGAPDGGCATADVNGDGRVDAADLVALVRILTAPPPTPVPPGPSVTFLGLAGANGAATTPLGVIDGVPVFFRNAGSGFQIVVEGRPGLSGRPPGLTTFDRDPADPSRRPDLQIESSKPLGDGSRAVCDGGVPAIDPPDFGPTQTVANTLNDLACNFVSATSPRFACTQDEFGASGFLGSGSQVQFCLLVPKPLELPPGETRLSVQLRDAAGNLGPMQQVIVRVGPGPLPPTFTPIATATVTRTLTPSSSATPVPSRTPTRTRTPTRSLTPRPATRTPTRTLTLAPTPTTSGTHLPAHTPTGTPTPSITPTPGTPTRSSTPPFMATPSSSATASKSATATLTPERTLALSATSTRTPTSTPSAATPPSATSSATRTLTRTVAPPTPTRSPTLPHTSPPTPSTTPSPVPTRTRTATPPSMPTRTRTPTKTATRSPTATETASVPIGPVITFFGVTRADDTLVSPVDTSPEGLPIYSRPTGAGFSLIVEGKPGLSGAAVGRSAYQENSMSFPDLQVQVSRPLGNGSVAVCDRSGSTPGGVPAIDPQSFEPTQSNIAAVNDFACRFLDGSGAPLGRKGSDACVLFPSGDFRFANLASTVQFCGFITRVLEFPPDATVVTARLLDVNGNPGEPAQLIIRAGP